MNKPKKTQSKRFLGAPTWVIINSSEWSRTVFINAANSMHFGVILLPIFPLYQR